RGNEVRLLLGVIAYNLGNLLRRLVLPVAIQAWSLTSLQQRLLKTGGRLIRHAPVLHSAARRKLLDQVALSANTRAHRAAGMAPDMIAPQGLAARRVAPSGRVFMGGVHARPCVEGAAIGTRAARERAGSRLAKCRSRR